MWKKRASSLIASLVLGVGATGGALGPYRGDGRARTPRTLDFADGWALLPEFRHVFEIIGELPADTNKDGALSEAELTAHYGESSAKRVMELDTSGDGLVEPREVHEALATRLTEFEDVFRLIGVLPADLDADGAVSEAEIAAKYGDEAAKRVMLLDANADGRVSLSELHAARGSRELRGDANADGRLSPSELRDWGSEVFDEFDLDKDGDIETHEILRHEADYRSDGLFGRFVDAFGSFKYLTPRADIRRMWSVLKNLECACTTLDFVEVVNTPCLVNAALDHLLDAAPAVADITCRFPDPNATLLTADELSATADAVLVRLPDLTGDIVFRDFAAFVQRDVPAEVTGAISHLVDAGAFTMARSLVVQQLVIRGLQRDLPELARDAAHRRYVIENQQRTARRYQKKVVYNSVAQWTAYFTVMFLILTYIYVAASSPQPHPRNRAPRSPATNQFASSTPQPIFPDAVDALARHQLLRAYVAAALAENKTTTIKSPIIDLLFRDPPLPNLDAHVELGDDLFDLAQEAGRRDAPAIDTPNFLDLATKTIADLDARRRANMQE
ncbi:hypothetical protein CTAYLR_007897 [Chrysophaeum taylorii]|uniref:EF-hand domain-containing protein n=1 Tax=Chrysophaeum taylorii TaxID=2483200 RepID=A0AAD7UM38_9STRA|nr:hypothetical protein CTAYLR_007897 [Chrysophaeum taylorii]